MNAENKKTFIVKNEDLSKADQIVLFLHKVSRSQLRALFHNECVKINGQVCLNPGTRLKVGDCLDLQYDPIKKYKEKHKNQRSSAFNVVYEDGHLIVVDKQPGILTVPSSNGVGYGQSLLDHLNRYLPNNLNAEIVHRLDRDTSGLLVFAKSKGVRRRLKEQFEARKPQRIYNAFLSGVLKPESGTIESYLTTDKDLNEHSTKLIESGKLAITHYTTKKSFKDVTWVEVKIDTGRRNQIRVHFSEKKHPVIGDQRYQKGLARHDLWQNQFLALHASYLGFFHPISGKKLVFESGLPLRMKAFLEALEPLK